MTAEGAPRILLTGMSGVGKSRAVAGLRDRGHRAIDVDATDWWYHDEAGHQRWRLDPLRAAMAEAGTAPLFIAGCAEDQTQLAFSHRILLHAPWAVIAERIRTRSSNPYGQRPDELRRIRGDFEQVEPLLRRSASHEIDATQPTAAVVDAILAAVDLA